MKFKCDKTQFAQLFSLATSMTSTKDIKVILQNVKVIAKEGTLIFMAIDTELGSVRIEMKDAEVIEPGEAILPSKLISESLASCKQSILTFEYDGNHISLFGGGYSNIPTQDPSDFADVDPFSAQAYHEVDCGALREMIRRTSFAVNTENQKYAITGVLFEMGKEIITTVATDGRRMACQEAPATAVGELDGELTAIVPIKALNLLTKYLGSGESKVAVAIQGGKIYFYWDSILMSIRLVEGRFPNWRRIIPDIAGRVHIDLLAGPFLDKVNEAKVVTSEKQPGIFLDFTEGKLTCQAFGLEGNSSFVLPISFSSEPVKIKVEPRYVIELLKVLPAEKLVTLYVNGTKALLFQTDDHYQYVLMPMT